MGLKVLLADDSAAITKVIQICLQDFGVEVKSIGSGKDVLDVAKTFKPDIAFIDVMLPHKPGFDVAAEIKNDVLLKKTPVIMLWSSFMEFDEDKFKKSLADGKLEKPFDAKDIRTVINTHVLKAQTQPLASHVQMPKVEFPKPKDWNMSSFADPDSDWVRKDLQKPVVPPEAAPPQAKTENKFKLNLNPDGEVEENTVSFQYDDSKIKDLSFVLKATVNEPAQKLPPEPPTAAMEASFSTNPGATKLETPMQKVKPVQAAPVQAQVAPPITEDEIKKLVEQEVRKLVAQIVPDLAEQLIKEEIQKLTQ